MSTVKILQVSEIASLAQNLLDCNPDYAVTFCQIGEDFVVNSTSMDKVTQFIGALERVKFELLLTAITGGE